MREIRSLDSLPEYVRQMIEQPAMGSKTICPVCNGGRTGEISLSVRQVDDGPLVKLSCWRATCNWYCYVGDAGLRLERKKLKEGRVYMEPTAKVSRWMKDQLASDYGLKASYWDEHGWRQAVDRNELVMPVLDQYGRERGHVTRTFDTPKRCFTYKATQQPWLDWWVQNTDAPVVVVEDTLSACRLAGVGLRAVALLGTSMTIEQAREIAEVAGVEPVHLSLDRDAFDKALKLRDRFQHVVGFDSVYCLDMDIKNMDSDEDIRLLFHGSGNG
jgi:hypothetical protein